MFCANCFLILMDRLKFSNAFRTVWFVILGGFKINFNPKLSTASSLLLNTLSHSICRPGLVTLKQSGRAATLVALISCRNWRVSSDAGFRRRLLNWHCCHSVCWCVDTLCSFRGREVWGFVSRRYRFLPSFS